MAAAAPPVAPGSPPFNAITKDVPGGEADAPMPSDIESLQQEVRRLRNELEKERAMALLSPSRQAYRAHAGSGSSGGALGFDLDDHDSLPSDLPAMLHQSSQLPDGTTVFISEQELAGMRSIFDLFDYTSDGKIDASELVKLHARLGEPVTEEEAKVIVDDITAGQDDDLISFEDFCRWWNGFHSIYVDADEAGAELREKRRKNYMARFKFIKAQIPSGEIARIRTETSGTASTLAYRVNFTSQKPDGTRVPISPWHDIPLRNADGTLNFVCEIPKWTRKKFEIATGEPYNPIKQDTKNGALREYKWGDQMWNYGAFPQTWEDPAHKTQDCDNCIGDNDPLDVIDIGQRQWATGSIVRVKPLGIVAMIDSGETDWKVISINVEDPMAHLLHDLDDVQTHCPNMIESFVHWLKYYKSDSGVINAFGFGGTAQNREYAEHVIEECHTFWKQLIQSKGQQAVV